MEITSQLRLANTLVNAASSNEAPVNTPSPKVVSLFDDAMEMPAPTTEMSASTVEPSSAQSALHSLAVGDISHTDLYQTQFAMSMLKLQGTGGSKSSQQLTQDVETLMKQQG